MSRAWTDERLKARRNAARKYRRHGYSVVELPAEADMPSFLHGFAPDLVATSEDDNVVWRSKGDPTRSRNWLP
jgi:hypothetical protein